MSYTLNSTAYLNNGIQIPRLGLGVYQIPPGEKTINAVKYALKLDIETLTPSRFMVMNLM